MLSILLLNLFTYLFSYLLTNSFTCLFIHLFHLLQNEIRKDDHIIVSVSEDPFNVLEEHSSAVELKVEISEKDKNNKMYNTIRSTDGTEGKRKKNAAVKNN